MLLEWSSFFIHNSFWHQSISISIYWIAYHTVIGFEKADLYLNLLSVWEHLRQMNNSILIFEINVDKLIWRCMLHWIHVSSSLNLLCRLKSGHGSPHIVFDSCRIFLILSTNLFLQFYTKLCNGNFTNLHKTLLNLLFGWDLNPGTK